MGYALSSVSAQCVGAGDYKQVRYYTKKLMGYSYASMLAMNLLIIAALSFIIKVYNLSPETGKMAEEIIPVSYTHLDVYKRQNKHSIQFSDERHSHHVAHGVQPQSGEYIFKSEDTSEHESEESGKDTGAAYNARQINVLIFI